jgi:hypothetical protein
MIVGEVRGLSTAAAARNKRLTLYLLLIFGEKILKIRALACPGGAE